MGGTLQRVKEVNNGGGIEVGQSVETIHTEGIYVRDSLEIMLTEEAVRINQSGKTRKLSGEDNTYIQ